MVEKKRILLIENFTSDFVNARLKYAQYLVNNYYDVYALIPKDEEFKKVIINSGITVLEYEFDRKNKGLIQIFRLSKYYRKVILENKIDIVHSFRFQPNLFNSFSKINNTYLSVLHVTGLGISFSNNSMKYKLLGFLSQIIYLLKHFMADVVIYQNPDDINDIWATKLFPEKCHIIKGSGIDTSYFDKNNFDKYLIRKNLNIPIESKVFICVTRLIWEKGVKQLVDAFKILYKNNKQINLYIVGAPDYDNPRHVDDEFVRKSQIEPNIFFLGKRNDIPELLAMADVFILPSYYREGIPRSILEALSMSLPIITTNMPGCNLTVVPNENGFLIKPYSTNEITKFAELILSSNLDSFSYKSRRMALDLFQDFKIFSQISTLYS